MTPPCRKARFASALAAQRRLDAMLRDPATTRPEKLGLYRCRQCNAWHIGNKWDGRPFRLDLTATR